MKPYPYSPPEGYYDLPFTWIFNGSALTDGSDSLNRFVYMQGGYGDFILRRIVGMDRVLQSSTGLPGLEGGRFRIYDRYSTPLQSAPIYAQTNPGVGVLPADYAIVPEEIYPELGKIGFDLYDVLKAAAPATAQVAFQGVRRMKGTPRKTRYRNRPKMFTYVQTLELAGTVGTVPDVIMRQQIRDYDFELYDIRLLKQQGATVSASGENLATIGFTANSGLAAFTLEVLNTGAPGTPFGIVVVPGVSITIQGAIDGGGACTTTGADLLAAYNATPDAVALASMVTSDSGFTIPAITPPAALSGAQFGPITDPVAKLWIRDADRIAIASEPMLDIYCDGGPGSVYGNGAIVTPLLYPKDQQIQIDVSSMLVNAADAPTTLMIEMVGRQLIPC